jgi:hypothetical protein
MGVLFQTVRAQDEGQISAFRARLDRDNTVTFTNLQEFGELRTVRYDGETFTAIPVVLDEVMQSERYNTRRMKSDYGQGLYKGAVRLHCRRCDLEGKLPEHGAALEIESERKNGFFRKYTVLESRCDEGMLMVTLERVDE